MVTALGVLAAAAVAQTRAASGHDGEAGQPAVPAASDAGTVRGLVDVTIPDLDGPAAEGAPLFADTCAACHGAAGSGTEQGPPLIHVIYEPSHHGDLAFLHAVRYGVRAHHWRFGDMPPQLHVGDDEIAAITAYVRAVQRANGID